MPRALLITVLVTTLLPNLSFAADDAPKAVLNLAPSKSNPRNSEGDFVTLKDNRVLFVYTHFTGGTRDDAEAHLASRVSADGGITWSDADVKIPAVVGTSKNTMSVSLLRLPSGHIALFCLTRNGHADCRPYIQTSADEGKTWSEPRAVVPDPRYYVVNNARVVRTTRGRLVMPAAYHGGGAQLGAKFVNRAQAGCLLSDDDGKTWRHSKSTLEAPPASKSGLQEPGVIELKDGRLLMLCRTDQRCQMRSFSDDGGDTWSAPERAEDLPSPLSPATLARIPKTGDLLVIWNNNGGDRGPQYAPGRRTPLSVAVSKDDGKTWLKAKDLETDPNGWFCYTAAHFVGDDRLLLGYVAGGKPGDLSNTRVTAVPVQWLYR